MRRASSIRSRDGRRNAPAIAPPATGAATSSPEAGALKGVSGAGYSDRADRAVEEDAWPGRSKTFAIVDLSRIVAGPLATQILGDYGAEVIKVEHPQGGDDSRQWAPPRAPDGQASYFFAVNRGKRSITIDLKHPRGKALVLDLARRGDVLDRELQARAPWTTWGSAGRRCGPSTRG